MVMLRGSMGGTRKRARRSAGAQDDASDSSRRQDAALRNSDQTGGRGCAVRPELDDPEELDEPLLLDPELEPLLELPPELPLLP
jgi:hypothetical protein